jgi:hypothetical protein
MGGVARVIAVFDKREYGFVACHFYHAPGTALFLI